MIKCKEAGYHDWEVLAVNGTLPYQELELQCRRCEAEHTVTFDYEEE